MTKHKFWAFDAILYTATGISTLMLFVFILTPGMDYGTALGSGGFAITLGLIVASVLVACGVWSLLYFRQDRWTFHQLRNYVALSLPTACLLFFGAFVMIQNDFEIAEYMVQNKVEHFCLDRFDREQCVTAVHMCPKCALRIDKWKRNKMVANLNQYAAYFPKNAKPAVQQRAPASVKRASR